MKVCGKCREEKPGCEFGKDSRNKTGLRSYCRPCEAALRKMDRAKNPEASRAAVAKWKAKNTEKVREMDAASALRKKARWEADPESYRERNRKEYARKKARDAEGLLRAAREFRRQNPDKVLEYRRRYVERNPEKHRARVAEYNHSRRAKTPRSREVEEAIVRLRREPCHYCGNLDAGGNTVDHVVPLARGGSHALENLVPACMWCNASKGAKLLSEWPGPPRGKAA